jgi:predicted acetyltransferase
VKVDVSPAAFQEKIILRHLLELYQYDLSDVERVDVDGAGLYGYEYLDHYWTEKGRHPFLVRVDGQIAGFVLVSQYSPILERREGHSISEFFIMKRYRRTGVGAETARQVFDLFPGRWEVCELADHTAAQIFWRKVIARYTGGQFEELFLDDDRWQGPIQVFDTLVRVPDKPRYDVKADRQKGAAVGEVLILDLSPQQESVVQQAAALLVESFKDLVPDAWPDMDKALLEVHESLHRDRISRVAVDARGMVLGWVGGRPEYDGNVWELHPRRHPFEFYQKLAYVVVGIVPDANGPGKPDILMAKRLQQSKADKVD